MPRGGEKGISRTGFVAVLAVLALLALPGSASAATITPSITTDEQLANANCSLREAIKSINNLMLEQSCVNTGAAFGTSDTVQLMAGQTYTLTVPGQNDNLNASGDLDALVSLTINGNAANPPTIREDNSDNDRVLHSPNQTDLTLRDLVITDGGLTSGFATPQFGGNISYHGDAGRTLLLDNVDVTSGVADTNNSGDAGGGIFISGGGQITIQDSLISGNTAGPSNGGFFQGGGIAVFGDGTDVTVTNSTVSNNSAGVGTITDTPATGSGGGIYLGAAGMGIVNTFSGATIDSNHAGGGAMGVTGDGGGIELPPGPPQSFAFTGGTISNNTAGGGATGATGDGGGLFLASNGGSPALTNATVTGNEAGGNGGSGSGFGGGIRSDDLGGTAPTVTLNHTTVANNTATGVGGEGGNLYLEGGMDSGKGQIRASIVAGGMATNASTSNCFQQATGVIDSGGFNLESTTPTQCNFVDVPGGDLATAANLFLGALGNNGGPTQTVPLLAGSPAIDRVTSPCTGSPATDQRGAGFARQFPPAGACDSGAYELQDLDGDGILDTSDNCPTQAGPPSNGGCPLPVVNPPVLTPPASTSPTSATPPKKKCKKKKKGAAAAKKCKKRK